MIDDTLVFASLIPADPDGDPRPCQAWFEAPAEVGGKTGVVRVMDQGIAQHACSAGGWAMEALQEALAGVRQVHVGAPTEALASLLSDQGIARDEGPVRISDYGPLTQGMALNGITVQATDSAALEHPCVVNLTHCGRDLADELSRRWQGLAAAAGGLEARAYQMRWALPEARTELVAAMRRLHTLHVTGALPRVAVVGPGLPEGLQADPAGLQVLGSLWRDDPTVARLLDDIGRRAHFSWLADVRGQDESAAMAATQAALGSPSAWGPAFKRYADNRRPRVVVVPTWQCELRCRYCTIPKQGGRVMSPEVLDQAIDLLLSADQDAYALHFFGGEPFLEWPLIQHAVKTGEARLPGRIQYRFTTNGWALSPQRLRWLADYDVHLQLSLDGTPETQNSARRALERGADSYEHSPAQLADLVHELGIDHDVIQVVHPSNAAQADTNFSHLLSLGYRRIQLNYALGSRWSEAASQDFAAALHRLGHDLRRRWAAGEQVEMVNLQETRMRVRTNREVTVDWDGTVMSSNGFLYVPDNRDHYVVGHLDDQQCFDRYVMDGPSDASLLSWWYPEEITRNNQGVGAILMSFVRWMTDPPAPDA